MRKAFAQKGFGRLFAGLTTSMLGDSVLLLVLAMWVKTLTGSNGAAGLTFFWMVIPSLFASLYGRYVDRVRRKSLFVWGNVVVYLLVFLRGEKLFRPDRPLEAQPGQTEETFKAAQCVAHHLSPLALNWGYLVGDEAHPARGGPLQQV